MRGGGRAVYGKKKSCFPPYPTQPQGGQAWPPERTANDILAPQNLGTSTFQDFSK